MSAARRSVGRTLEIERRGLEAAEQALRGGLGAAFASAAEMIEAAGGNVIVTGMGKSGHVGRKIAATLASTGTPSHFVHPGEASHGDLGMIRDSDVVLALSWSGETPELSDIVAYTRRFGVRLIAITLPGQRAGKRRRCRADTTGVAGGLSKRAGADDVHDDADGCGRCAGGAVAGAPGIYVDRFSGSFIRAASWGLGCPRRGA